MKVKFSALIIYQTLNGLVRIVRIKGVMDSEGKGKSGPVVAKVAPVSAVRWAGQAG